MILISADHNHVGFQTKSLLMYVSISTVMHGIVYAGNHSLVLVPWVNLAHHAEDVTVIAEPHHHAMKAPAEMLHFHNGVSGLKVDLYFNT